MISGCLVSVTIRDVNDRKTTSGFIFFMGVAAFGWSSKKQPIVTLSTCEVEYVAVASCVCHGIWLRKLLGNLKFEQTGAKMFLWIINQPALAKNPIFH